MQMRNFKGRNYYNEKVVLSCASTMGLIAYGRSNRTARVKLKYLVKEKLYA